MSELFILFNKFLKSALYTKNMSIVQVDLVSEVGKQVMTTWVDNRPDLKEGIVITLRGDYTRWFVVKLYTSAQDIEWHREWDIKNQPSRK
jgi:hypothetical protein